MIITALFETTRNINSWKNITVSLQAHLGSLVARRNMPTKQHPIKIETYAIQRYCSFERKSKV